MTRESYYNDPANRPLLLSKSCVGSMPSSVRNSAILKRWAGTPDGVSLSATPFGPFHPKPPEVTLQGWQRRIYGCADTKLHNIFLRLYHGDSKYSLLNCKELVSYVVSEFVYSDVMWSLDMRFIEKKFPHYKISGAPDFDSLFRLPENHMRIGFNARPIDNRA
jgi:hypothetical protein